MTIIPEASFAIVHKIGGEHLRLCRLKNGQHVLIERLSFDPKDAIGRSYGMFEVTNGGKALTPVDNTSASSQIQVQETSSLPIAGTNTSNGHGKDCQQLTSDQIMALKDGGIATTELVSKLVSGNSFFQSRTKFSKEKYVRKKAHKHSDRIIILKPSIRLLTDCYYRKDPERVAHLRIDQLGLILNLSAVHSYGCNVFVFEQVLGLLGAAVLERICGNGSCIFLHRGDWPQSIPCLEAIDFDEKHRNTFLPLRITTFLGEEIGHNVAANDNGDKLEEQSLDHEETPTNDAEMEKLTEMKQQQKDQNEPKKSERAEKERRAMELIQKPEGTDEEASLDAICLACRTVDPIDVLQRIFPALRLSGTLVIYSPIRQHLINAWQWLRSTGSAVDIQLSHQFYRAHQVLPNRTHPLMLQSVSGGYVLYATKVLLPHLQQTQQREQKKELQNKHARID